MKSYPRYLHLLSVTQFARAFDKFLGSVSTVTLPMVNGVPAAAVVGIVNVFTSVTVTVYGPPLRTEG